MEKLETELKQQTRHVARMMKRLEKEKDVWFQGKNQRLVARDFVQYCLFLRWSLSPVDALFCSRFIMLMNTLGTEQFNTLGVFELVRFFREYQPVTRLTKLFLDHL